MTMTQTSPIEPFDDAVGDYRQQARQFMVKSRQYLADGDLHQASEKGWGAAAWMAKAVAEAQGWDYTKHAQFSVALNNARQVTRRRPNPRYARHRQRTARQLLHAPAFSKRGSDQRGSGPDCRAAGNPGTDYGS